MTILEKIKFEEDWLSEVNLTKENIKIALAGIRATALEQTRWIPVSERLPEDFENVLVWYEYFRYGNYNKLFQTCGLSYTYGGHWSGFVNGESGWKNLRIIAWMPLPEPYKAESEDVE